MRCSNCKNIDLIEVMAKSGVMVDYCPKCEGIWLDKGEIYYFTKASTYLKWKLDEALKNSRPSLRLNPHTQTPLVEISLFEDLVIDYCPQTQGIWLDKGELESLPAAQKTTLKIDIDKGTTSEAKSFKPALITLPNLGLISGITLFSLYALVSLILIILVNLNIIEAPFALMLGVGIALFQFLLSPFLMDFSLRFFYRVKWVSPDELPQHLENFITEISRGQKINIPRIGIIPDGSPNAFTYGHTPANARIVVTAGIMDLLQPEELEAVVAHEVGHVVHWDMLVMTVAYLVPLLLYYIYRTLIRMKSRGNDKSALPRYVIALIAYILYLISEYIVLWFSRTREYFADRFAGEITNKPVNLASALVKIGYGLAGKGKSDQERKPQLESIKAMGLFDPKSARALAVSTYHPQSMGGEIDKENLKGAMRWDLWNPWAMYYELHSTHPLIAKRLLALSRQSEYLKQPPYINFNERKPESYWDEFMVDLFMKFLPVIVIVCAGGLYFFNRDPVFLKTGLILLGGVYLLAILFSYRSGYFPEMNIASLLKKVKVSGIRAVPCAVKGKLIGRGVPGLIWSEDFVLQDDSGIMFLDYRQPLGIWNFLFGLLRSGSYIGREVTVTGWYRRAPVPYIEIKNLKIGADIINCYAFPAKIAGAILLIAAGIILLLVV